ncbi:MAG: hypothetical protein OXF98_06010, partial [Rhodospirillaceae bacterium]|nr:hypothetical protein [Rhodospirillaceae bacterium]
MSETTVRLCAALAGLLVGVAFVGIMSSVLSAPEPGQMTAGGILLDRSSPIYPFTIQNLMWGLFFVGLADVLVRLIRGGQQSHQIRLRLLP